MVNLKYILFILFTITMIQVKAQSLIIKCDTMSVNEITKQDYTTYIGKQVQDFITLDNIRHYNEYVFFDNKPGVLTGVLLKMSENFSIEIVVSNYKHVKQIDYNRNWDFNLFKKERINTIRFLLDEKIILEIK